MKTRAVSNTLSVVVVKKAYYDAQLSDNESKHSTTSEYNKFTNAILNAKINEKIVNKLDIFGFTDNSDLDKKIAKLAAKAEL